MSDEMMLTLKHLNFSKEQLESAEMLFSIAHKICDDIRPLAPKWDVEGVKLKDNRAQLPKGMKEIYSKIAESGLLGTFIPEEFGGAGLPYTFYAALVEIFSRACPCIGVSIAVHGTTIDALLELGTTQAKKEYLPKMAKGEMAGDICFSEPHAGRDEGSATTKAEKKAGNYVLNGNKIFLSNGGFAHLLTTIALTDPTAGKKGQSAFIVDCSKKGFIVSKLEDKMGQHASPTAMVNFEDFLVPEQNLLGKEGKGLSYVLQSLTGGRIEICAQATGIAQEAFDKALKYAKERKQFGVSISEHQAIAFKLADMSARISAARKMYLFAAMLKDGKVSYILAAAQAKLFGSEMGEYVTREAIQIHGGYGYIREYDVERHYRDVRVTTIYEGTSEIQRLIISRELLK